MAEYTCCSSVAFVRPNEYSFPFAFTCTFTLTFTFIRTRCAAALRNLATAEQHVEALAATSTSTPSSGPGRSAPSARGASPALRALQAGDVCEVEALMGAVCAAEATAEVLRAERDVLATKLQVWVGGVVGPQLHPLPHPTPCAPPLLLIAAATPTPSVCTSPVLC
jgi:hypothetical protein